MSMPLQSTMTLSLSFPINIFPTLFQHFFLQQNHIITHTTMSMTMQKMPLTKTESHQNVNVIANCNDIFTLISPIKYNQIIP